MADRVGPDRHHLQPRRRRQRQPRGARAPASRVTVASGTASCPCSIWTPSQGPRHSSRARSQRRRARHKFRSRRRRVHHRDPLLQESRRTPGRTSGTCGPSTGALLATVTFASETASGLAGSDASRPRRDHREHDLRGVLSHGRRSTTPTTAVLRESRRRQRSAARAADGADGANGVYQVRCAAFPDQHVQQRELLGGRRLRHIGRRRTRRRRRSARCLQRLAPRDVPTDAVVTATFSETMNASTVTARHVRAAERSERAGAGDRHATTPARGRRRCIRRRRSRTSATYTATREGRQQRASRMPPAIALAADFTWSFTTSGAAAAAADAGPGRSDPRRLRQRQIRSRRYYAEILRAEGLNEFAVTDISPVTVHRR